MTPARIETARAFVACKGWRWLGGMLVRYDGQNHRVVKGSRHPRVVTIDPDPWRRGPGSAAIPSHATLLITDRVTLGAIEEVVRIAHGADLAWCMPEDSICSLDMGPWACFVRVDGDVAYHRGNGKVGALLAALRAGEATP